MARASAQGWGARASSSSGSSATQVGALATLGTLLQKMPRKRGAAVKTFSREMGQASLELVDEIWRKEDVWAVCSFHFKRVSTPFEVTRRHVFTGGDGLNLGGRSVVNLTYTATLKPPSGVECTQRFAV